MNEETRRFSLEKDFMNLKTDDLIYGFIQYLATYIPEKKILYVPTAKVSERKKDMAAIIGKGRQTVDRHIKQLLNDGLLNYEKITLNGISTPCYIVPQESIGFYQIVKRDMLWYVLKTRSRFCIKIYVYLLNKNQWKKNYHFTTKELVGVLGYQTEQHDAIAYDIVDTCLRSLKREGIIDYTEETIEVNNITTTNKVLKKVCENEDQLF